MKNIESRIVGYHITILTKKAYLKKIKRLREYYKRTIFEGFKIAKDLFFTFMYVKVAAYPKVIDRIRKTGFDNLAIQEIWKITVPENLFWKLEDFLNTRLGFNHDFTYVYITGKPGKFIITLPQPESRRLHDAITTFKKTHSKMEASS